MSKYDIDPLLCPLCEQQNQCANLGAVDTAKTCWCNDPNITFPRGLLDQVPAAKKGKACICESCARTFSQTGTVNIFNPNQS